MQMQRTLEDRRAQMTARQRALLALDRSRDIRRIRQRHRRRLESMRSREAAREAARIIRARPPWAEGWRIGELITAVPWIGHVKRDDFLKRAGHVRANQRLREVSDERRENLARLIVEWGER